MGKVIQRADTGVYESRTGEKYDGPWRAGKKHGQGTLRLANGDVVVNNFFEDEMNGEGEG